MADQKLRWTVAIGCTGLAALASFVWLWREREVAPPPSDALRMTEALAPPTPDTGSSPVDPAELRVAAEAGTEVDTTEPDGPKLHVRLRGLHSDAPWTVPLELELEGRDDANDTWPEHRGQGVPDAEGKLSLSVPAWARTMLRKARLDAEDPNYQTLQYRSLGAMDFAQELVLDVQVEAVLTGRVVDIRGQPVRAARISAFTPRTSAPGEAKVAECNTDAEGRYRLSVAPNVQLRLITAPTCEATGTRGVGNLDGGLRDTGELRSDLLPAMQHATGRVGSTTQLDDFVLPDSSRLRGIVQWSDGTAVHLATVATLPPQRKAIFALTESSMAMLGDGDVLVPAGQVDTEEDGSFELAGVSGAAVEVRIVRLAEARLLSQWPRQSAVAPQQLTFRLPRPIQLRVTHQGVAVPHADVAIAEDPRLLATGADGTVAVVTLEALRVRAQHEQLRSAWQAVEPAAEGTRIDLELGAATAAPLGEVVIEFEGDHRVRNTIVTWRCDDGRVGTEHLLRDDHSGPFRLFLEPGHYHVHAGPGGGERNGLFLLPVEHDVDVTAAPTRLVLPASFGGRFVVHATDGNGRYVAGSCHVFDASGADCSDRFSVDLGESMGRRHGAVGDLLVDGPNSFARLLPPGDYLLTFDFPQHGAEQRRLSIQALEVTELRLRLP